MRHKRIYVATDMSENTDVSLDAETSHYLLNVLRCRKNDKLEVFNGSGGGYRAFITGTGKKSVTVRLEQYVPENEQSGLAITLAYGISRGSHMDFAIQKAVELGVSSIAPLFTAQGNVRLDEDRTIKRMQHWKKIIIHACEQCGRSRLPELIVPQSLSDWLEMENDASKLVFSADADNNPGIQDLNHDKSVVLIGPEGGFSDDELHQATAAGYKKVKLGSRILRTETAVAAAITVVQVLGGDMRKL